MSIRLIAHTSFSIDTDTVSLASGLVLQKQSIGVASSSQGFQGIDGILGVGPVDLTENTVSGVPQVSTVSDNLRSQGKFPPRSSPSPSTPLPRRLPRTASLPLAAPIPRSTPARSHTHPSRPPGRPRCTGASTRLLRMAVEPCYLPPLASLIPARRSPSSRLTRSIATRPRQARRSTGTPDCSPSRVSSTAVSRISSSPSAELGSSSPRMRKSGLERLTHTLVVLAMASTSLSPT